MRVFGKKIAAVLAAGVVAVGLFGCGSASNNDQGVSFSLDAFLLESSVTQFLTDGEAAGQSGAINGTVTVSNFLSGQGIRVQRVFLSYNIPGASVTVPSTSVGINLLLGPGSAADPNAISDLPDGFNTEPTKSASFPAVTNAVRTFLAFNRTSLPELPFEMEITAVVRGVTTAGDVLETNAGTSTLTFTPDIVIPPESTDGGDGSAEEEVVTE